MATLACTLAPNRPTAALCSKPASRQRRAQLVVYSKYNKKGPVNKAHNGEEGLQAMQERLAAQGMPMPSVEAVEAEVVMAAVSEQRPKSLQSIEADEEYKNMNPVQKYFMEFKAALYSWLKTGVEI